MTLTLTSTRLYRSLGMGAITALLVAACSGSSTPPPTAAPVATPAPAGGLTIATASTSIGTVLTGKDGMTLYVWAKDTKQNASNCTSSQCVANWPAATVAADGAPTAGSGVTGTLATFSRPDGTSQVSYNGAALYYFAGDKKAGDTNGQGVGGVWFAAGPNGQVGSPAPAGSPAAQSGLTINAASMALGSVLTGNGGMTLYVFANDTTPNASACTSSQCVANWLAARVGAGAGPVAGSGVTGTLATFKRSDGSTQVSYNGTPLYYFAGDKKPGDTNGQGVAGLWTVALASGGSGAGASAAPSVPPTYKY